MKNHSAGETNIDIGFPISNNIEEFIQNHTGNMHVSPYYEEGTKPEIIINDFFQFKCFENSKRITCSLKKASEETKLKYKYEYFFVSNITFKGNEEKEISCIYNEKPFIFSIAAIWTYRRLSYILQSGRFWRGNIEKVNITFNIFNMDAFNSFIELNPADYKKVASNLIVSDLYDNSFKFDLSNENIVYAEREKNEQFTGLIRSFEIRCSPDMNHIEKKGEIYSIEWIFTTIEPDFDIHCEWIINTYNRM